MKYKGFGKPPKYRIVVSTYNGGFVTLRFPAASKGEAIATSKKILQSLSNPDAPEKLDSLLSVGIPEDEALALLELGREMAQLSDRSPNPEFLTLLATRMAIDADGTPRAESLARFSKVVQMLKGHHFLAALHDLQGRAIMQYSNLVELQVYQDWRTIA